MYLNVCDLCVCDLSISTYCVISLRCKGSQILQISLMGSHLEKLSYDFKRLGYGIKPRT